MAPKKPRQIEFKNVAVPLQEHALLKEIADVDGRSMARELAFLIREAHEQIVLGKAG